MIAKLKDRLPKAVSACGLITLVADLAEPLGPIAMLVLVAAVVTTLLSFLVGRLFASWQEELAVVRISGIMIAAVSGFLVLYQSSVPAVADRGLLGANIPAVADLQTFLSIDQRLADIQGSSRETADNTAKIARDTQELVKSSDPRKELSNLGVAWTIENMAQAMKQGDLRTLELFLAGGMDPLSAASNCPALAHAILDNKSDIAPVINLSVKYGLDVNRPYKCGSGAGMMDIDGPLLASSVTYRNGQAVDVLLSHGAEITPRIREIFRRVSIRNADFAKAYSAKLE